MLTVGTVLAMSLMVTDAHGYHPIAPIAVEGAVAIVEECNARAWPEGCGALLVVFSFHESLYDLQSVDPDGWTCGPFQTLASHGCPTAWRQAVRIAVDMMLASAAECRRQGQPDPLAWYASGSCTNRAGIKVSRDRMAEAVRIASQSATTAVNARP